MLDRKIRTFSIDELQSHLKDGRSRKGVAVVSQGGTPVKTTKLDTSKV